MEVPVRTALPGLSVPHRLIRRGDGPGAQLAILFPGWAYGNDLPLLRLATQVLLEHGHDVLLVDYDYAGRGAKLDTPDDQAKLLERLGADATAVLRAAREAHPGVARMLLLGKSLGTHALAMLAEDETLRTFGPEMVWLTPICESPDVARAMRTAPGPALVVIGTADPHRRQEVLSSLAPGGARRVRVLEVDGADHALEVPGSSAGTLGALAAWRDALAELVSETPPPIEVARRWMEEVWRKRRTDVLEELHAPSFVDRSPSGRGTDLHAYRHGVEELLAAFPDFQAVTEDIVADPGSDRVAIRWTATGTHRRAFLGVPPSGRRVTFRGIEIVRVAGGRITERWGEWDGLHLLEQLRGA